jgi:hypothetical protein
MDWADIRAGRMFQWRKEMDRLDIPATQVFHLERSLSAVQVALPGLPSQEATAYLCVFSSDKGLRVALVLHLHTSRRLAFYLREGVDAPQREAGRLIEEGVNFAESLGFMLSNVDFRKLATQQRSALWNSLPLKNGVESSATVKADASGGEEEPLPAAPLSSSPEKSAASGVPMHSSILSPPSVDEAVVELSEETSPAPQAKVDEIDEEVQAAALLSAASAETASPLAEAVLSTPPAHLELSISAPCKVPDPANTLHPDLPARQPAMRSRLPKKTLRAEDVTARRQKFLESLGRFLASM